MLQKVDIDGEFLLDVRDPVEQAVEQAVERVNLNELIPHMERALKNLLTYKYIKITNVEGASYDLIFGYYKVKLKVSNRGWLQRKFKGVTDMVFIMRQEDFDRFPIKDSINWREHLYIVLANLLVRRGAQIDKKVIPLDDRKLHRSYP